MATVTVELTANQVIGAKDHFGTEDNLEALAAFRTWISNEADGWYLASFNDEIAAITSALLANPALVPEVQTVLGL